MLFRPRSTSFAPVLDGKQGWPRVRADDGFSFPITWRLNVNRRTHPLFRLLAVAFAASLPAACALGPETTDPGPPVVNEVAAKALAHRNNCLRCHGAVRQSQ